MNLKTLQTPCYYYNLQLLEETLETAKKESERYGFKIHYALKANNNPKLLKRICQKGFGVDCVSGQEILRAVDHHFPAKDILFAGVGKTDKEIEIGINQHISCFNIESLEELKTIAFWATKKEHLVSVALRLNPNVEAKTHQYITTGLAENKFGIFDHHIEKALQIITDCSFLKLKGIHVHVGSQITDLRVFKRLCYRVNEWNIYFEQRNYPLEILNLGGGLGVDYLQPDENPMPDFQQFFALFEKYLTLRPHQKVYFELGRSLVAHCGNLIAKVLYIKKGKSKNFAILDAGMTEFIRPALYQATHRIDKMTNLTSPQKTYDIVGPICESSDCFAKNISLPQLQRGDLIAIRSTGAYGEVMASRYNLREPYSYYYKNAAVNTPAV